MFTVEDLKPGMLVKLVDDRYGVIIPVDTGLGIIGRSGEKMSILTSNITFYPDVYFYKAYSVIAVYDLAYNNKTDFFLPGNRTCLWKYDSTKEMTIAEIEKELGYSIKIVKEH